MTDLLQRPRCKQPTRAPAGSGLGRNKQGIVTPLMHQKTDKRGGVIISGPDTWNADAKAEDGGPEQKPKVGGVLHCCLSGCLSRGTAQDDSGAGLISTHVAVHIWADPGSASQLRPLGYVRRYKVSAPAGHACKTLPEASKAADSWRYPAVGPCSMCAGRPAEAHPQSSQMSGHTVHLLGSSGPGMLIHYLRCLQEAASSVPAGRSHESTFLLVMNCLAGRHELLCLLVGSKRPRHAYARHLTPQHGGPGSGGSRARGGGGTRMHHQVWGSAVSDDLRGHHSWIPAGAGCAHLCGV